MPHRPRPPLPTAATITQLELDGLLADRRQARASLAGTAARLRQVSAERDTARRWAVALERELAARDAQLAGAVWCADEARDGYNRMCGRFVAAAAALARVRQLMADDPCGIYSDEEIRTAIDGPNTPSEAATGPHGAPQSPSGPEDATTPERPPSGRTGARDGRTRRTWPLPGIQTVSAPPWNPLAVLTSACDTGRHIHHPGLTCEAVDEQITAEQHDTTTEQP